VLFLYVNFCVNQEKFKIAKKDIKRLEGRIEPKTKRSYEDQARLL